MKTLSTKYGGWAVVTGASSGIGRSFAHLVARDGMNVVLVARSEDALKETADELHSRYSVQTRVLALDLTEPLSRETLDRETVDLDVGLLINNAAVEQRGAFLRDSDQELRNAIELNVAAPTELGQRFGRRFIQANRGGIIFVSGSIGYQAVPNLANYAATKAHQANLAEALYYELRPYKVDVLGLSPGLTTTPMVGRLEQAINFGRIGMLQLTPEYVAKQGLKELGRRPSSVVGLQYKIFALLTKHFLSRAAGAWVFGTLIRMAFRDTSQLDPTIDPEPTQASFPSVTSRQNAQPVCALGVTACDAQA